RERALDLNDAGKLDESRAELLQLWHACSIEWTATRVRDDHLNVVLTRAGEVVEQLVVRGARLLVRRQRSDVAGRETQVQERRPREQDERDDRDEHGERTAHHRRSDGVPPAPAALIRLEDRDSQTVDARSKQSEERGKEGETVEDRARHHDRAGEAHGRQERAFVEEHPRKTD